MEERVLGPFRLMKSLGKSPEGEIFEAWDTRSNRALELVNMPRLSRRAPDGPSLYRAFSDEVARHVALRHPALRTAVEYSHPKSLQAWYVLEPFEGISLQTFVTGTQRLPWIHGAAILERLATALQILHDADIVHGHIRPDGVQLGFQGRVVLGSLDFAIKALIRTNVAAFEGLDSVIGEGAYVAPEILRLASPSPRSDMFSLGVLAFELLTGQRPFSDASAIRQYARNRQQPPPDPWDEAGHLPKELRDVVRKMLAASPTLRPDGIDEVLAIVRKVLKTEGSDDVIATLRTSFGRHSKLFGVDEGVDKSQDPGLSPESREAVRATRSPAPRDRAAGAPRGRAKTAQFGTPGTVQRTPAVDFLRESGYLDKRVERRRNVSRQLLGLFLLPMVGLVLFYVFVLGDSSGSRVVSREATARSNTALPEEAALTETATPTSLRPTVTEVRPQPEQSGVRFAAKVRRKLSTSDAVAAERIARDAISRFPGRSDLQFLLAEALLAQNKVDAAAEYVRRGDRLGPKNSTTGRLLAGDWFAKQERHAEALGWFEEALLIAPTRAAEAGKARALVGLGRLEEARELLLDMLAGEQTAAQWVLLGDVELRLGRTRQAVAAYRRAQALSPSDRLTALLAKLEGSESAGTEAASTGLDVASYERKGDQAFRAGRYTLAVAYFRKAVGGAASPPARLLKNLALAVTQSGDALEAARAWSRVVRADAKDQDAWFNLGHALRKLGRSADARRALERAAKLKPNDWKPQMELGQLALAARDWGAAAERFRAVLKRDNRNAAAMQNLGKALMEAGDKRSAAAAFVQLGRLKPGDASPLLIAAQLYTMAERPRQAEDARKEACRRGATQACQ